VIKLIEINIFKKRET